MSRRIRVRSHFRTIGRRRQQGCTSLFPLVVGLFILSFITMHFPLVLTILLLGLVISVVLFISVKYKKSHQITTTTTAYMQGQQMQMPQMRASRYIPDATRLAILARDNYKCCACGSSFYLEMDHIIPLSRGGATSYSNLQTLCHGCNLKKGNR